MDFDYLTNVITKLQPIMTRALPIIWTALVLWFLVKLKR